jgi:hypothetical protein
MRLNLGVRMRVSSALIVGGLLYGKLALILPPLYDGEPSMRLVFNVGLSIIGILTGLVLKAMELRRAA